MKGNTMKTETCQVDTYFDLLSEEGGAIDMASVDFFEDCCSCPACAGMAAE